MLKLPTTIPLLKRCQSICKEQRHPLLTENQHESPCPVSDKSNQQWRATDASLHPCLDEPHSYQNEKEALKNETGHPRNQVKRKSDRDIPQGFGRTKGWAIATGRSGGGTRSRPALMAEDSG